MNERIKELVRECGGYAKDDDGGETKIAVLIGKDVEMFAELIVRECMSICDVEKADYDKCRKGAWDFDEKNIYSEGAAACDTIKYKMKHRFGVK